MINKTYKYTPKSKPFRIVLNADWALALFAAVGFLAVMVERF